MRRLTKGPERKLKLELEAVRTRLAESEATLAAIYNGHVDAIVVKGPAGDQIFTLQSSEDPYRTLAERMNEGAATLSADGTIMFCNRRLAEMLKLPSEQMVGSSFASMLWTDHGESLREILRWTVNRDVRTESELVTSDGTVLPVQLSLSSVIMGETEKVFVVVVTDLTELNRAKEVLREKTENLEAMNESLRENQLYTRSLFEANIDALMTTDPTGVITDVNQQMEALTGCTREELIGTSMSRYFTDPERASAGIRLVLSREKVSDYQLTAIDRTGRTTVVSYNATTFYDRNRNLRGVFVAARDITDRKLQDDALREASDRAEAANRVKGDFLANMSHEIRTPMNAIVGMAHLALAGNPDPRQQFYLTRISKAADSLISIINDILDFSKMEAGKMELEQIPFLMQDMLDNVRTVTIQKAEEKKLILSFPQMGRTDALLGDAGRLGQILINLVNNAVKFTHSGSVVVSIVEESASHDDTRFSFSVKDTGIGMSAEQMQKLFRSFEQADPSVTRKYGGTGLGLAISKELCNLMGGTLSVETECGKGSTFFFTVPFKKALIPVNLLGAPVPASRDSSETSSNILIGRRVLLVEDNEINRELAMELMADLGISVSVAVDGREGAHRIATEPFDLVLMDIQMPVMDGLTATRLVRLDLRFVGLPIIAMTAHAMSGDREKSLAAGMNDHLTKPIDPDRLRRALVQWMPRQSRSFTPPPLSDAQDETAEGGLPQTLAPFDLQAALMRTNGKSELLRKMMLSFCKQFSNAGSNLHLLVNEEKMAEAERLAHSLKGLARTLEANVLGDASEAIELALRKGTMSGLHELIESMEEALRPAIYAAESLETFVGKAQIE